MGISIYYSARLDRSVSPEEDSVIQRLLSKYSVKDQIEHYNRTGEGPNWESFCVYNSPDPESPDVIFEGATKLPDNSEDDFWIGLQHWCRLLSDVRRVLHGASWDVHVDDYEIAWDSLLNEYDPSR